MTTRDEMLALLREIEFAGWNHDGYDPGDGYCPSCGVDPDSGLAFEPEKHGGGCKLAEAIAWLEDEGNCIGVRDVAMRGGQSTAAWPQGWVLR